MTPRARIIVATFAMLTTSALLLAHSGPPFPIVTDATRGPYTISIWTDPDATDDGTPAGQFWVVIALSPKAASVPPETRATVSVRAITGPPSADRPGSPKRGAPHSAVAAPVRGETSNQFAAIVMDHEGPYEVRVDIDGPLGRATIDSRVDATYDLRPAPYMLVWYLLPFLLAGFLWTRLLLRRRRARHGRAPRDRVPRRRSDKVHVP